MKESRRWHQPALHQLVAPEALDSRGRDGGGESDADQEFSDDEAQAAALAKVVI